MPQIVHAQPWEIRQRLAALDLTLEPLQKAAEIAFRERALCTENDPPFIPGTQAWRFALRTLREDLPLVGSKSWRAVNLGNYSLVMNDTFKTNIMVATGDLVTGLTGSPRTKSVKGLYTQAAIERNNHAGDDLFPETIPEEIVRKARALGYPTWVYLIFTSEIEVRAELSFPEDYEGGEITSWKERIFIPDIKNDPPLKKGDDDNDSGPEFDIPVSLKP